ncbi:MAG: 50S ribosomal protein L21 [Bdellovibrionales bacterium]|nr:50S ribosomal protein L21 [Bdellovibrionales bacterium]
MSESENYAVIDACGHQMRVEPGCVIEVNRINQEAGQEVLFNKVYLARGAKGVVVGAPTIAGAVVKGEVLSHPRGPRITVFKKRRRQGYRLKQGHRQDLSRVKITTIEGI